MASETSRIPLLLQPFIHLPPKNALYVITSVLGASANWVILRYLYAVLAHERSQRRPRSEATAPDVAGTNNGPEDNATIDNTPIAVVLVSWLQDWEFWKSEARRVVGINLEPLRQQYLVAFIDALHGLFVPHSAHEAVSSTVPRQPPPRTPPPTSTTPPNTTNPLAHIESQIQETIATLQQHNPKARILLLLDAPTLLLATHPSVTSRALTHALLRLRRTVHAGILAVPADDAFILPAASAVDAVYDGITPVVSSPLEVETAAFVMGCVHQASRVLSVRRLETGWAGDVSGVVRATRGGSAAARDGEGEDEQGEGEGEGEWLYHVRGDGAVRVWGRGRGG